MKKTKSVIGMLALILLFSSAFNPVKTGLKEGEQAPELSLQNAEDSVSLQSLKGRYVLLNFWAGYDAPSRMENIRFAREIDKSGLENIALVSVSCGEDSTETFPDKGWGELTTPVLSVSDEEVALDADSADQEALTLSWTSAGDDASIRYELYLNVAGSDLFSGYKREMGSDLTLSLTHTETSLNLKFFSFITSLTVSPSLHGNGSPLTVIMRPPPF